ncbi:transcriptional regulator, SarA/Rot family [Isobaculum melis]|uniref:MarR family transcriptional regulator, protease production regulatory protein HPr n=1 Tax=Isobaculum melis TaxID=142588 RepID=A0A1H9RJV1_9LACT|nr:hypothetical protein [Isobaculum melis]SER72907.1 MarR family transcriptional regulator, protease production regulatory protein HPr [Isobaculum melis]
MMNEMTSKEELTVDPGLAYHSKLFWLAKAMWRIVEQDWQDHLRGHHLTINEYSILRVVAKKDSCRVTDVSSYGLMHVSTALNSSQSLKKRGLVHLEKDVEDTRVTIVTITEEGRELLNEVDTSISFEESMLEGGLEKIESLVGLKPSFSDTQSLIYSTFGRDMFEYFSNATDIM